MRYAILSDLHGNEPALRAIIKRLQTLSPNRVVCLGDIVGYNPFPDFCVRFVSENCDFVLRGNHDKAVAQVETCFEMNGMAESAIRWTRAVLSTKHIEYLTQLPAGPVLLNDGLLICHGTPMDEDRYLVGTNDVRESFAFIGDNFRFARFCAVGHTHIPLVIGEGKETVYPKNGLVVKLERGRRYLLNPGSVGQPRDGDFRASFGILDTEQLEFIVYRVSYAVEQTQKRILEESLHRFLAERLAIGA